jgi:hypothetical protein
MRRREKNGIALQVKPEEQCWRFGSRPEAGLPDGRYIFKPNIQNGYILEGLGMENIGILNGHWEYSTAIWYF